MSKENDAKLAALSQLDAYEQTKDTSVRPLNPIDGWIDIDREKISYCGTLYKSSLRFQAKPANIGTIKYFSTLDEGNPLSVNDALTFIIEHHIRVLDGNRSIPPLEVIQEHDRFFFTMIVHNYSGAPTALTYKSKCTHDKCNHEQEISITPWNLRYTEISDKGKSYLNPTSGEFVIPSKSLGTFNYRPLTLTEAGELTEFMLQSRRSGHDIQKMFLSVAPFIVTNKTTKDTAADIYQKYLKLTDNVKVVSLLQHLIELINVAQKLEIEVECRKCSRPFRSPISSVKGLRNIFLVDNIANELSS